MKDFFGVEFSEMIYIGDNPKKDFAIKEIYNIITAQVEGRIYSHSSYAKGIEPDYYLKKL